MTQMLEDTNLEQIRSDPRYVRCCCRSGPRGPVRRETRSSAEWDGEAANDQFGWVARVIGDVDADGVQDFATSAPCAREWWAGAGRIYVYSTPAVEGVVVEGGRHE